MSTKIYDGVRFPKVKLDEFVREVRIRGLNKVYDAALKWVKRIDAKSDNYLALQAEQPNWTDLHIRIHLVTQMIKDAAASGQRAPWIDVECGWRIWLPPGRFALAIPWGEQLVSIDLPEWVEEYGYWNNTDSPEGMTARRWRRRKKDWQIACEPWCRNHGLCVEVFKIEPTPSGGTSFGWLEIRLFREGKWGEPA